MASSSSSNIDGGRPTEDVLRSAKFARRTGDFDIEAPTAASVLGAYDASRLHPLAAVNSGELDYLLLDDDKLNELEGAKGVLPSRGWGDELCCEFQRFLCPLTRSL